MAGRRAGSGLALAAIALSAAGCGFGGTTTTVVIHRTRTVTITVTTTRTVTKPANSTAACTGSQLSGTFNVEPGSGGAGQITYDLVMTNTSTATCTLSGLPVATLLDANGSQLPTHVTQNDLLRATISLSPGNSAKATARFSPSVPGTGDSQSGACQPKAHTLEVTPNGGGTVDAPIKPPTSVCERGTLHFSQFAAG